VADGKSLSSGWAFNEFNGGVYHFEHIPLRRAETLAYERDRVYVVEAVNWTHPAGDQGTVHFNKYFVIGLPGAIAFAAHCLIDWEEVAEDVVGIRAATAEEEALYWKVSDHYHDQVPPALSDAEAAALPEGDA
jgi:hypothetical protein